MPSALRLTQSYHTSAYKIMSLNKTITTDSGYEAEYWKTTRMDMHLDQPAIWVYLAGYKDKAAFDAGLEPVTTTRITVKRDAMADSTVAGLITKIRGCVGSVERVVAEIDTTFSESTVTNTDTISLDEPTPIDTISPDEPTPIDTISHEADNRETN